jgi:predicted MFS family arabinose efflux permease
VLPHGGHGAWLWAVATALSATAASYIWLLLARVALGAVTATTGPTVASLTGDFFPAADRGRMYGFILGGDLVGSGIGYVVFGDISSLTSWRVAFWWLVLPSLALAWLVWRLPEPARGGSSRIAAGAERHYGISKPTATALVIVIGAGALAGVFAGGRVADRLLRRDHIRARVLVPAACLLALAAVLAPAIASTSVTVALPLLIVGAFLLGAPSPPLDAARLDIIHPRLWGRAEGVHTLLRSLGEAAAPTLFGYVSQYVFGGPGSATGSGTGADAAHGAGSGSGLEYTFLIFLIPLLAAGLLTLMALRTYPRDVATASASVQAISDSVRRDDCECGEHAP